MIVLKAIGGFFAKIGRWIKKTAWIQPLLIVGGIFAIIFAIPYITQWVQSWFSKGAEDVAFWKDYKVSLDDCETGKSKADELFTYMENYSEASASDKKHWGEKFFVAFVAEDCAGCTENYKPFKKLVDDFGENSFKNLNPNQDLIIYTIFTDSVNSDSKNLFNDYFFNNYEDLFAGVSESLLSSPYCTNKGGESSSYGEDVKTIGDHDEFKTPTIFLFDPSRSNTVKNKLGVKDALFIVDTKDENTNANKAKTIYNCWFGLDMFDPTYKPD